MPEHKFSLCDCALMGIALAGENRRMAWMKILLFVRLASGYAPDGRSQNIIGWTPKEVEL